MTHSYTVVVTGPIGAGKSTVTKAIAKQYKMPRIPEFVETQVDGLQKLQDWISGKLSESDFQRYIVESYDKACSIASDCSIRVFERSPWDGYTIFSQKHEGYKELVKFANEVMKRWDIPSPTQDVVKVVDAEKPLHIVLKEVYKIIEKDLIENRKDRIIYLRIGGETSLERTSQRGRKGEESYSPQYLANICQRYDRVLMSKI